MERAGRQRTSRAMPCRSLVIVAISALICSSPASAQTACGPRIKIDYYEDASDYFVIENLSASGWTVLEVTIDLKGSLGDLIFDTVAGGAGVSGFEPFQGLDGRVRLTGVSGGEDGGQVISLSFAGFAAGEKSSFSIDLDDRLVQSLNGRSLVAGREISGARARARLLAPTGEIVPITAQFDEIATADSGVGGCV